MRPWPSRSVLMLGIAVTALAALSACTTSAPPSVTSSAAEREPTSSAVGADPSAAAGVVRCADLVDSHEVIAAFAPHGRSATGSLTPTTPYDGDLSGPAAVTGAGGLACRWSVRTSASSTPAGALLIQVLPRAASQWSALMYGDGPTQDRRTFAGITAAATCGDPGCGASAVVGSSWVRLDMSLPGDGGPHSLLGEESPDAVLAGAAPMIGRLFDTVEHASAAQLVFPKHPGSSTAPRCEGILPTSSIAPLLASSGATYQLQPLTGQTASIGGAAAHEIGAFRCFAEGTSTSGDSTAALTVAPGQAWAVAALQGSTYADSEPLRSTRLDGATRSETAETTCVPGRTTACTTVFSLGQTAIQVEDTPNATKIAEAVIAFAR